MKSIDFHTHILPDEFRTRKGYFLEKDETFRALFNYPKSSTVSAENLTEEMNNANIETSVVLGYGWTDSDVARVSNDYLLDAARRHPGELIPFCSVALQDMRLAVKEVERCFAQGARGVGELHISGVDLSHSADELAPLMDCLHSLCMPCLIHASEPVGHTYPGKGDAVPPSILKLASAFPDNRFILAHFGGGLPFYSLMPEVEDCLKNVWYDSAAAPYLYTPTVFDVSVRAAGIDKILFASDFPIVTQRRALQHLHESGLTDAEMQMVLCENANFLLTSL